MDGQELRTRISFTEGGFITVSLVELRDVVGAKRLGKFVLEEIREWLKEERLGFFPRWMLESNEEPRQTQELRLFDLNDAASPLSLLVNAIDSPSSRGDRVLRALSSADGLASLESEQRRLARLRFAVESALDEYEVGSVSAKGTLSAPPSNPAPTPRPPLGARVRQE
jgi:hypothetical protein